jgi:zinc transport system substrate-binding protein
MEAGEHGDHSHGENELDPHIWMAPDLVANQVKWLGSQLSALFPDSASLIHKRAEALRLEFEALHKTLKSMLLPLKGRVIYVFHPAYGYFARSYGLIQKAVEFEGKEPSAGRLAMLIQQAKADKIKVLFVQPQFSIKTAKIIADSLGAAVVPINPLSEDLLENLKQIAQTLLQYLP